ncbi:hypothetical protein [Microbacterium sp. P02]|uniref:hypothetical protein n=1 Tax=Microbacterium sp. P02 TaxID=3366260 RepID=UPI00366EB4A0
MSHRDRLPLVRRGAAMIATVGVVIGLLVAGGAASAQAAQAPQSAAADSGIRPAADLSSFRAGNIMSDATFFNSGTMSQAQIQSFLQSKVPSCQAGYTCLKDARDTSRSTVADAMCGAYTGAPNELASTIIYKVAQACGINPQVLLVTLQKEQGLVTHTWPSSWRYEKAMGQGCPDTAGCDVRYLGFFNQVYGAAWQFKRYANPAGTSKFFTWYAPGNTWSVLYNPNRACGSSPVYVENQATANLYYYTPYQPNASALRAGYGEGDGCGAYGNRNFFQYFTDWFGSTQTPASSLVIAGGRAEIYLISGGTKHRVATLPDLNALRSRLGSVAVVDGRYVDSLPTGGDVGRYVHDARSGTLYLLEADGSKHRFTSVAQVQQFGYPFVSYVNLEPRQVDAFASGPDVGAFVRSGSAPEIYLLDGGAKRHINDQRAWQFAARDSSGYVASMDAGPAESIAEGATYFEPNTLVRAASSGDVYLTTPTSSIVHIPSFALAAEFGATRYAIVPDSVLAKSVRTASSLAPVVACGDALYVAAGGTARPFSGDVGGTTPTALGAADCGALPVAGTTLGGPVFVQPIGRSEVYVVQNAQLRHIRSFDQLMALNAGRPLTILRWSIDTATWLGIGAPLLAEGALVQFTGTPEVYRFSAGTLQHVTRFDTLIRLGQGRLPVIEPLPAAFLASYAMGVPFD